MDKPKIKQASYMIRESVLERLAEAKKCERWSKSQFVETAIVRELDRIEQKDGE